MLVTLIAFLIFSISLNTQASIDFSTAMSLKIGAASEKEVSEKMGSPEARSDKNDYYTLNYDDPKTGYQRLSLNFDTKTQLLVSVLWVPAPGEKESTLKGAQERFKGAKFVETKEVTGSSHSVSTALIYIDEQKGISIRYNPKSSSVEALAKYDPKVRTPASANKD